MLHRLPVLLLCTQVFAKGCRGFFVGNFFLIKISTTSWEFLQMKASWHTYQWMIVTLAIAIYIVCFGSLLSKLSAAIMVPLFANKKKSLVTISQQSSHSLVASLWLFPLPNFQTQSIFPFWALYMFFCLLILVSFSHQGTSFLKPSKVHQSLIFCSFGWGF